MAVRPTQDRLTGSDPVGSDPSGSDPAGSDPSHPAGPFPGIGTANPTTVRLLTRLGDDERKDGEAQVAEEVPVALVYGRRPHVVMMATPADLEDFAVGFTLSERIAELQEIRTVSVERHSRGIEVSLDIGSHALERLDARRRSLTGRTGCGLCGVEAIDEAVRMPEKVESTLVVDREALWRAGADLERSQPLNAGTHAIHGAGWADATGQLRLAREDVGRHNALDKVLGALARAGTDAGSGFVVVTSRASVELVQKCAACGVPLLAAVSRPTNLAIRMADASGICLVGLLRGRTANVYSHPDRIRL